MVATAPARQPEPATEREEQLHALQPALDLTHALERNPVARAYRAGYSAGERPEGAFVRRALLWGLVLPGLAVMATPIGWVGLLLLVLGAVPFVAVLAM